MEKNVEELKIILDMASNGGKMQAQNEMLQEKLASQDEYIKSLEEEKRKLQEEVVRKTKECEEKDQRIAELEAKAMYEIPSENADEICQSSVVLVNNFYYVLSWPKTVEYVGSLDSNGRVVACHFIHHTLPDNMPVQFIKKVDDLTKLEGSQEKRLADAIEKVADRPTTENHYDNYVNIPSVGTYNNNVEEQNNQFPMPQIGRPEPNLLSHE